VVCASQPSKAIRSLVSGYPREIRERKLILILQAYADDSGNSPETTGPMGYFVLAGYIMREPLWEAFSDRWAAELVHQPSIRRFKMREAEAREGDFQGMSPEFCLAKIKDLSAIIEEFEPLAISCTLNWQDYKDIVLGKVHPKIDSPYAILFYQIMKGSHEYQITLNAQGVISGYRRVDFVFDDQGAMGLRALQWYAGIKTRLPEPYSSMMGSSPAFRNDEEIVALQAADMLAWHVHRGLDFPEKSRPIFETITRHYTWNHINRDALYSFLELVKRIDPRELEAGF
jgi:hypothetical protein